MIYVLSKNKKKVTFFHLKIQVFTAVKNCSILHGRVIVMSDSEPRRQVSGIAAPLFLQLFSNAAYNK